MPIHPFEYEYLRPTDGPSIADEVRADPDELVHPDAAIAARATTELRKWRPRRFVFYDVREHATEDRLFVSLSHQGYQYGNGSVFITAASHPHGWYRSVASAWRRLRSSDRPLWLAWLEPETAEFGIDAAQESRRGKPSTCYVSIPFSAFGQQDARVRAANIVTYLRPSVPGLDPLDVTFGLADYPDTESHVYCDQVGCLLVPGHSGDHDFTREPVRPSADTAHEAAAPAEADAGPDEPSGTEADEPPSETDPR